MKHNHSSGGKMSPTYSSWSSAKQRCTNPNHPRWSTYGGKGITMDPKWTQSFQCFLDDMGVRPEGMILGRINLLEGYSKANCRWMTVAEPQRNRAPSRHHRNAQVQDPNGNPFFIRAGSLSTFCKTHGLTLSGLSLTLRGKHKQHKGWTGRYLP